MDRQLRLVKGATGAIEEHSFAALVQTELRLKRNAVANKLVNAVRIVL